jgi:flagellar protein FliS
VTVSASARSYREAEVLAATPTRLVVITFDGMLACLTRARAGMAAGDADMAVPAIGRARAFVGELLASLDHQRGGDLASRLSSIYLFVLSELQTIVQVRSIGRMDRLIALMRELRDAFAEIDSRGTAVA